MILSIHKCFFAAFISLAFAGISFAQSTQQPAVDSVVAPRGSQATLDEMIQHKLDSLDRTNQSNVPKANADTIAKAEAIVPINTENNINFFGENGIVIVSHAMGQIEQICDRTIWIDDGVIRMEGKPRDVHPHYMEWMSLKDRHGEEDYESGRTVMEKDENGHLKRWGSGEAQMEKITVSGEDGQERNTFSPAEPVIIHVDYTAQKEITDAVIGLAIYRNDGTLVYGTNTLIDSSSAMTLKRQGTIDLIMDNLPVANGEYTVDLAIHRPDGFNYDFLREVCKLYIAGKIQAPGFITLPHRWEIL